MAEIFCDSTAWAALNGQQCPGISENQLLLLVWAKNAMKAYMPWKNRDHNLLVQPPNS